jgi:hypothetical protein
VWVSALVPSSVLALVLLLGQTSVLPHAFELAQWSVQALARPSEDM